jgi:hypothetical protein
MEPVCDAAKSIDVPKRYLRQRKDGQHVYP